MMITRRGRLSGPAVARWRVAVAVAAVVGGVALSPGWAPAAPTIQAVPAERPAPTNATARAGSKVTVKVSCPQTHRGAGGLQYCDRP
jgi:hypothetical protein